MAGPNFWENDPVVSAAPAQGGPQPGYVVPDPQQAAADAREAERLRIAQADEARRAATFNQENQVVGAPGNPNLTGDEYLATLPPALAGQVKALAQGRRAFPTGTALKDPHVQALIAAATQYDPALDAANAATRVATRRNFTSGKARANITAINTALGHLGTLEEKARALDNTSFPLWNRFANATASAVGDPRIKDFGIARDAVANELMRVFRQVGASTTEIEDWKQTIGDADSPEQLKAEIGTAVDLLNSRLLAMQEEYSAGMGQSADVYEFLSPHAKEVFNRLAPGVIAPEPGEPGAPSGGAPSPPPNAMTRIRIGDAAGPGAAGAGASQTSSPYPPEMIAAHDQMVAQLMAMNGGRIDPEAYVTAKADLTAKFNYRPTSPEADAAWAQSINQYLDAGGKTVPGGLEPEPRDMSMIEQGLNNAANTSQGAYFAGAANALTAGTIDEIAGAVGGDGAAERAQFAKNYMRDQHPIASFAGDVTGAAMAMVPVAAGAQALGRTALAGEMAYGAAYGAGDNNDNRLLGAAAGAAGAKAGDWLGGKLLQKFGKKIPADAADEAVNQGADAVPNVLTPAQRFARAQEQGVDLSIGDVRGMGAKATERLLDVQPGSAGVMNAARNKTRQQLTQAVENVAAPYGSAATADSMGDALQAGARRWIARAKGEKGNPLDRGIVGKAYDAVPIQPNSRAQFSNTLGALEELNGQFSSNPKLAALMRDTRVSKLLDALGDVVAPENEMSGVLRTVGASDKVSAKLSWSDLKALRSAVGEDMQAFRIGAQDSRQSTLSRLYGALSEDMRATAAAQGPAALAKFERANTLNRQVEARIENTLTTILGRDGAQTAEKAAAKLRAMTVSGKSTADFRQLAEIRKSMPKEEWGEVSGALIRLMGQPAKSEGRDFSADTFVRTFTDMSDSAKNLIFGGPNSALRKNLDEFVGVAGDVAASNATRNTSNTAMGIAGLVGFGAGGLPALITQAVGSYGAAKLWTNPQVVRWATGYTRMMNRAAETGAVPTDAAIKSQLGHLDRLAKASGPVSAEIIVLRDYLANAAAQSPERLAAEPTTEGDRP